MVADYSGCLPASASTHICIPVRILPHIDPTRPMKVAAIPIRFANVLRPGAAIFIRTCVVTMLAGMTQSVCGQVDNVQAVEPQITVTDGFVAEKIYSVPLENQGSWVCMVEAPDGDLMCGDQRGGLYRLPVTGDKSSIARKIPVDIGHAQGLAFSGNSLYVVVSGAAANGPGLYRVQDSDGDNEFDHVEQLITFELTNSSTKFRSVKQRVQNMLISSGHGPHGLRVGPDGMLYIIGGNHTRVPENVSVESPYRNYDEDLLLPRIDDAQGIATGILAPGGWILKSDLEGKNLSLVAGGLRNAYDLAFHSDGELFTVDSDMEFDKGAPWYRPCRVSHLISGGEYGWRYGSGKWPEYYADSLPAVVDLGFGSPTGVEFGTGAAFPPRYQRAMFAADWAYGRIWAIHFQPSGASYRATFETFLSGKPLPVVDLLVHSDGNLYFLTGGRKTQSEIYRVKFIGAENNVSDSQAHIASFADQRDLRRQLESLPKDGKEETINKIFSHLNASDRTLRFAARVALERQPIASWIERARSTQNTYAIIQSSIALARHRDSSHAADVLLRLNELDTNSLSTQQFLEMLRAYALTLCRLEPNDAICESVAQRLIKEFPSAHGADVNRELCRVLVRLDSSQVIGPALGLMQHSESQEDQFFYAFALRSIDAIWTIEQRKEYFLWLLSAYKTLEGGDSFQGFVKKTVSDALRTLSPEEKPIIAKIMSQKSTSQQPRSAVPPKRFVHNWQRSDLLSKLRDNRALRSFESGQAAYRSAQCDLCHRMNGNGASTGPDLTGVGGRFTAEYLLEAILDPDKVIPEAYRSTTIVTEDGEVYSGRITSETDTTISMRLKPFESNTFDIPAETVVDRKPSRRSEMPSGLANTLSADEILDLIAYLRSAANPNDPIYQNQNSSDAAPIK